MYAVVYIVSTPLVHQLRCETTPEVRRVIGEYMDGRAHATLDHVTVIEVFDGQPLGDGLWRDPAAFWP